MNDDDSIFNYDGETEDFIDFRGITGVLKRLFSALLLIVIVVLGYGLLRLFQ